MKYYQVVKTLEYKNISKICNEFLCMPCAIGNINDRRKYYPEGAYITDKGHEQAIRKNAFELRASNHHAFDYYDFAITFFREVTAEEAQ